MVILFIKRSLKIFYRFIIDEFDPAIEIINAFKILQWGMEHLMGRVAGILGCIQPQLRKKYPKEVEICSNFINQESVARKLLYRFIVTGKNEDAKPNEYIYFGNVDSAYWARTEDIITLQLKNRFNNSKSLLSIGNVSIQSWGRTLKNSIKDQRASLQVKMSQLEKEVVMISKTEEKNVIL